MKTKKLKQQSFEVAFKKHDTKEGIPFYNLLETVQFPEFLDPSAYELLRVSKSNTPWTVLSYQLYGTTDLWWLLLTFNKISNPIEMPKVGQVLRVLKPSLVAEVMNELKT